MVESCGYIERCGIKFRGTMLTIIAGFDAMTLETQENVRLIRDFLDSAEI